MLLVKKKQVSSEQKGKRIPLYAVTVFLLLSGVVPLFPQQRWDVQERQEQQARVN